MAKAKKLPSGNWRARVYSHTTSDGKKHYESFTASTKQEAELQASKWAHCKNRKISSGNKTVAECIEDYIVIKSKSLSPATIKNYRELQKLHYKRLANVQIRKLTNADVQEMINEYDGKISISYIKSIYELFSKAIRYYSKDTVFSIDYPKEEIKTDPEEIKKNRAPRNCDVLSLYNAATPLWLKKSIALAAFSGLRRAEICAIKYKHVLKDENKIFIASAIVRDESNKYHIKPPKTKNSVRVANVPKEIIELIGDGAPEDFVIGHNPDVITNAFIKLRNKLGIKIKFHDLRHYYASIGNVLHVPDVTLADFAGWKHDSPVIKNVYQNSITDISEGYAKIMNNYFSELINDTAN